YGINAIEFYHTNNQPGVASGDSENRVMDNLLISRSKIGSVTEEPPPPITGDNIALNKQVTTSSSESNSTAGGRAVDGNPGTRWASLGQSAPQWVSIDLGDTYTIEHVKLFWEAAYASGYQIQTSLNGNAWTDVYSTTDGDGAIDEISFAATDARYVRMYGTVRGSPYGFSLYE
ncbi:discoidin domain-containing protein, partial [Mycobacterium tuberculosis]